MVQAAALPEKYLLWEALIKIGFRKYRPKNRIADILSASGRSTLQTCRTNLWERLFALRAQADKMSAIRFHFSEDHSDAMRQRTCSELPIVTVAHKESSRAKCSSILLGSIRGKRDSVYKYFVPTGLRPKSRHRPRPACWSSRQSSLTTTWPA